LNETFNKITACFHCREWKAGKYWILTPFRAVKNSVHRMMLLLTVKVRIQKWNIGSKIHLNKNNELTQIEGF
jgi:hypothetical protein